MRIGELAAAAGTSTKTLRFYEEQGLLLAPDRTPAGYRNYDSTALDRLDFIRRGQAAGLTLAQIQQVLEIRDGGQAPCGHVRDLLDQRLADIEDQLRSLTALCDTLTSLRDEATTLHPDTCGPDQVCRYV
ncbi:heavy metal-responsive transcriptional regulator [Citricoccus nitrophenolicus]|uniref:Heavy metal-responsive transcriptional regulator n=1 Tax=Citricoccus nitrophenolicus TaxID=863575 RepID=A0ABV0IMK4_9MICC|nr:heavy metal-responsive transcriptional regulator [Citricoccus sp. I39-566]NUL48599.1 heavy metal-responsive transcriptional regulator [Cellulosimicrobium funkei]WMY77522.1 heavy metal-responsive transcriptional regulator [Citricoccus sp. I39-566]